MVPSGALADGAGQPRARPCRSRACRARARATEREGSPRGARRHLNAWAQSGNSGSSAGACTPAGGVAQCCRLLAAPFAAGGAAVQPVGERPARRTSRHENQSGITGRPSGCRSPGYACPTSHSAANSTAVRGYEGVDRAEARLSHHCGTREQAAARTRRSDDRSREKQRAGRLPSIEAALVPLLCSPADRRCPARPLRSLSVRAQGQRHLQVVRLPAGLRKVHAESWTHLPRKTEVSLRSGFIVVRKPCFSASVLKVTEEHVARLGS